MKVLMLGLDSQNTRRHEMPEWSHDPGPALPYSARKPPPTKVNAHHLNATRWRERLVCMRSWASSQGGLLHTPRQRLGAACFLACAQHSQIHAITAYATQNSRWRRDRESYQHLIRSWNSAYSPLVDSTSLFVQSGSLEMSVDIESILYWHLLA